LNQYLDQFGHTLGEELLKVHKSYLKLIKELKEKIDIKGLSHITGGGIIGNTKRIIPAGLSINIHWGNWEMPAIFKLIMEAGNISAEEMRNVFNLGIGLVVIVPAKQERLAFEVIHSLKEHALHIGEVV